MVWRSVVCYLPRDVYSKLCVIFPSASQPVSHQIPVSGGGSLVGGSGLAAILLYKHLISLEKSWVKLGSEYRALIFSSSLVICRSSLLQVKILSVIWLRKSFWTLPKILMNAWPRFGVVQVATRKRVPYPHYILVLGLGVLVVLCSINPNKKVNHKLFPK